MSYEPSDRISIPSNRGRLYAGTRLLGRIQETRRGQYVATRFIHCLCIPIAPLESYLILESTGLKLVGVQIPRNHLSIFVAYLRGISFLVLGSALMFSAEHANQSPLSSFPFPIQLLVYFWYALAVVSLLGITFSYTSSRITSANPSTEKWINEILEQINA